MIWLCAKEKRFFIAKRGWVGLGTWDIASGQRLAVVAGLTLPLVLVPFGERYRLIGHACVHGTMKGKAWPADSKGLAVVSVEWAPCGRLGYLRDILKPEQVYYETSRLYLSRRVMCLAKAWHEYKHSPYSRFGPEP